MPGYLNARQIKGLNKLGDAFIPGDGELPSFSGSGCVEHADRVLGPMPEKDRSDLLMLLGLLSYLPGFALAVIWRILEWSTWVPTGAGAFLRFLRIGLKGLVVTLYYSGCTGAGFKGRGSYDVLGYRVGVYTGDLDSREAEAGPRTSAGTPSLAP